MKMKSKCSVSCLCSLNYTSAYISGGSSQSYKVLSWYVMSLTIQSLFTYVKKRDFLVLEGKDEIFQCGVISLKNYEQMKNRC